MQFNYYLRPRKDSAAEHVRVFGGSDDPTVMGRHNSRRFDRIDEARGIFRVHGISPADRDQRDVAGYGLEFLHSVGVAGDIIAGPVHFKNVPEPFIVPRMERLQLVIGGDAGYFQIFEKDVLSRGQQEDFGISGQLCDLSGHGSRRDEDRIIFSNFFNRFWVEMIMMGMRDEDHICIMRLFRNLERIKIHCFGALNADAALSIDPDLFVTHKSSLSTKSQKKKSCFQYSAHSQDCLYDDIIT